MGVNGVKRGWIFKDGGGVLAKPVDVSDGDHFSGAAHIGSKKGICGEEWGMAYEQAEAAE